MPLHSIVYDANTVKTVLQSYMDRAGQVDCNRDVVFSYAEKVANALAGRRYDVGMIKKSEIQYR